MGYFVPVMDPWVIENNTSVSVGYEHQKDKYEFNSLYESSNLESWHGHWTQLLPKV
jgi:hypothetical protein